MAIYQHRFFSLAQLNILFVLFLLGSGFSMSVNAEAVWIDVRSPEEFAEGRLDGAILIPHTEIMAMIAEKVPKKDTEIYLYCRSGRRAEMAQEELLRAGYNKVTNYGSLENALIVAEKMKAKN